MEQNTIFWISFAYKASSSPFGEQVIPKLSSHGVCTCNLSALGLRTVHAFMIFERVRNVKLSLCHIGLASDVDAGLLKGAFKGKYDY